jgi:hypothetical protein
MLDLHIISAELRRKDLMSEAERLRRGAAFHSTERTRFRDGRRTVGRALIRAGHAVASEGR